jgi:hypothetical protein
MDYRDLPAIAAAILLCGTLIYIAVRWRKAPSAFRAMNWIATASLVAGLFLGAWSTRRFGNQIEPERREVGPVSGATGGAAPLGSKTPGAVSTSVPEGAATKPILSSRPVRSSQVL